MESHPYNFEEYISVTPSKMVKYSIDANRHLKDYTRYWISCGAKLNEDGTIDKSTCIESLMPKSNKTNGLISSKSNREVNKVIDWFVYLALDKRTFNPKFRSFYDFKLNFITVSLPSKQVHSDKILQKQLFMPFLDWLRKSKFQIGLDDRSDFKKMSMYFWRAESQANGNIHWHLCSDVFIPYWSIRDKWNYLCGKLGYIEKFKEKNKNSKNPNSTDVHSVRKIKSLNKYLSKYCAKNSKGLVLLLSKVKLFNALPKPLMLGCEWFFPPKGVRFYRPVYSRLWACSENLSKIKKCKVKLNEQQKIELVNVFRSNKAKVFIFDFCKVFQMNFEDYEEIGLPTVSQSIYNYYTTVFSSS